MRKCMLIVCALVAVNFASITTAWSQTFSSHQYGEDISNIPNPERGFYHHTETPSGTYSSLDEATLRGYRSQGITLILRLFYLNDFASKVIPESYLANMQRDFNTARAAGVKMVVRFAYTKKSTAPYGDATPEWALKHIAQLKPLLKQNGDVIAVMQAGFIGAWGEWYYTDHFSQNLGAPTAADWVNRRALVNALLDAAPDSRTVLVRTPAIKFSIVESTQALQDGEAFTTTAKARIGHHNDCFLASADDIGTYTGNITAEKAFLEQETQYVPMGGETCGVSVPLSECPNAMAQMERFHWSFLNRDYHQGVLGSWETGSCISQVFQKLGYRFRIVKSSLQSNGKPGGSAQFHIELVNDGWANPYNKRQVELVLKNKVTSEVLSLKLDEDPRRWTQSDTIKVEVTAGLPRNLAEGEYELFLHLPDPEITLHDNPDFAIRLANTDTWVSQTGYNKLNHTLVVSKTATVPVYTGNRFFLSKPVVTERSSIVVDGLATDWQHVEPTASALGDDLKIFNTGDSIYFLVSGTAPESFGIFIDADQVSTSGELVAPWNSDYADYRITADGIAVYSNGSWTAPQEVAINQVGEVLEIGIPVNLFSGVSLDEQIAVGVHIEESAHNTYLPAADELFVPYRLLMQRPGSVKSTSSGTKIILYWSETSDDLYHIIERSVDGGDFQKATVLPPGTVVYTDRVTGNPSLKYRLYNATADGFNVSSLSGVASVTLSTRPDFYTFSADGNVDEWKDVAPVSTALRGTETQAYRVFMNATHLNILYEGVAPQKYSFYFDMDNVSSTGSAQNPWSYQGFDFLLRNDSIYNLRVQPMSFVAKAQKGSSSSFLELAVPLSVFDNLNDNTTIHTAAQVLVNAETFNYPRIDQSPVKYLRTAPASTPQSVTVSNSEDQPETQLVIQWNACSGCQGYIIERSEGDAENFETIASKNAFTYAHYDNGLTTGTTYYYRVYSYNEAGLSVASPVMNGTPRIILGVEGEMVSVTSVYPNPTGDQLYLKTTTVHDRIGYEIINLTGKSVSTGSIEKDQAGAWINLSSLPTGVYILRVSGSQSQNFRIIRK